MIKPSRVGFIDPAHKTKDVGLVTTLVRDHLASDLWRKDTDWFSETRRRPCCSCHPSCHPTVAEECRKLQAHNASKQGGKKRDPKVRAHDATIEEIDDDEELDVVMAALAQPDEDIYAVQQTDQPDLSHSTDLLDMDVDFDFTLPVIDSAFDHSELLDVAAECDDLYDLALQISLLTSATRSWS